MTLKQLEAFYLAATLGSFALAAQRAHVTQSSLSKRIAELESSLDTALFDRSSQRAQLTEAESRLRSVVAGHNGLLAGPWPKAKQHLVGQELCGRIMGIVGFGEIGRIVGQIARGFGMQVLVCDPFLKPELAAENGASLVGLDELLARSGAVSLHAPLTAGTKHLINADRLSRMRADALLVNTARSGLVDEQALVAALVAGTIAGAAVDVADAEQAAADVVLFGGVPVAEVPHLMITPHIAGQTEQALLKVGMTAWSDIQAVIAGHTPRHPVGTPAARG